MQKYAAKQGEPTNFYQMDGGKYFLPEEEFDKFYELAAKDIIQGTFLCLAMVRTRVFPLFFDIDFEIESSFHFTNGLKEELINIINTNIAKYFPVEEHAKILKTIVLAANPREIDDGRKLKHGFHIHYPHLMVVAEMAVQIRSSIIAGLQLLSSIPVNDWTKAIDISPWNGSGSLRMLGAPKANPCDVCKGKKVDCLKCANSRYLNHIPSYYKLDSCYHNLPPIRDSMKEIVLKNLVKLLMATTVRSKEGTEPNANYKIYEGAPAAEAVFKNSSARGKPPIIVDPENTKAVSGFSTYTAVNNKEMIDMAETMVQSYATMYKNTRVAILKVNKQRTTYIVGLHGEGRNYCLKQKRDHRHNRIYAKIIHDAKWNTMYMCTGCPDDDCRNWNSRPKYLTSRQQELFFPPTSDTVKKAKTTSYDKLVMDYKKKNN